MTSRLFTRAFRLFAATAVVSVAAPAMADSTWNLGTGCTQQAANTGTYGNSYKCTSDASNAGGNLTVTAWGANATTTSQYQDAYLAQYGSSSGFGIASRYETIGVGSPNHSMDNDPTAPVVPDMILLKFDNSVALKNISLGWSQSDADITLMALSSAPTLTGKTASSASIGWSFIQNFGDTDGVGATGYTSSNTDINYATSVTTTTSSWWLISAYSSGFGGGTKDTLMDYVKLLSVAGTVSAPQPVTNAPEPGSIALVATAMLMLGWSRRRATSRPKR